MLNIIWHIIDWNTISRYNHQHIYPDTGGWAEYNAQFQKYEDDGSRKKRSVSEVSRDTNVLHYLLTASEVLELMDSSLADVDEYTMFVPSSSAIEKLPKDKFLNLLTDKHLLKKTLLRHIVPSKIKAIDFSDQGNTKMETISGEEITLQKHENRVYVLSSSGKASVTSNDQMGSNGIVYVVDTII